MKLIYVFLILSFCIFFSCVKQIKKEPHVELPVITAEEIAAENLVSDGIDFYRVGNYSSALQNWSEAIEMIPQDAELYNFMGMAYHRLGKIDSAITCYSKAVQLDSSYHQAWNNIGYMYFLKSDYHTAVKYFDLALKADSNYVQAGLNRQKTQEILDGKISLKAFELFEKTTGNDSLELQINNYRAILDIDSNYVDAWNNLGVSYYYYSNMDSAVYCIKKALDKNPDYAPAHNNAGYILNGLKKYDEAIRHYHKAILSRPNYEIALANLVDTYVKKGDYKSAKEILNALLESYPNSNLVRERYQEYKSILYN